MRTESFMLPYPERHRAARMAAPKDALGNPILEGDVVAYATRSGQNVYLRSGKVVSVHPDEVVILPTSPFAIPAKRAPTDIMKVAA